jgi:hypothetical protein
MKKNKENWISKEIKYLPDFIIGGAMKCGTTTLHSILNKHPKVFLPNGELQFFDIDDILINGEFNFFNNGEWTVQSMENDTDKMWKWYNEKFKGHEDCVLGEDSTTYLASKFGAERISIQKKEIKMLFILRQPSLRAYSEYIHLLRTGRAIFSFEDTIRFNPHQVIHRSLYKEQLEYYYKLIPKERIKVILFEELISKPKLVTKEISDFIGIDFKDFPEDTFSSHSNKGKAPISYKTQTYRNFLTRSLGASLYDDILPYKNLNVNTKKLFFLKSIKKVNSIINPLRPIKKKINKETKKMLDDYFLQEMIGIDELVGQRIIDKWFPERDL